jgi:hypothetical protein
MVEVMDEAAGKSRMRLEVKHVFAVRHPRDSIISMVQVWVQPEILSMLL